MESRHSQPCKYSNQNEKGPLEQLEYSPVDLRGKSNDELCNGEQEVLDGDEFYQEDGIHAAINAKSQQEQNYGGQNQIDGDIVKNAVHDFLRNLIERGLEHGMEEIPTAYEKMTHSSESRQYA